MQEYLGALIGVCLFGGVLRMISPEGASGKYLRLCVGLCLLCAMLSPLSELFAEGEKISWSEWLSDEEYETQNYDEIYNQSLQNGVKTQAEEIIKQSIYREYSLSEETAEVETDFLSENGILTPEEVRVVLCGEGVLIDPREIVSYVRSEWDCACTVLYG